MKRNITFLLIMIMAGMGQLSARQVVTVKATSYDISDNLDLEAVAFLFGRADNLEDFERKLNDPEERISNLDLNRDGYVDYLRVLEVYEQGVHLVSIQAVLGRNVYQEVATIDLERDQRGSIHVQVIGNEFLYGMNYIIEPVYVHRPVIFDWFWHPYHTVWVSPYRWNYYPDYYRYRRAHAIHVYHHHIRNYYMYHDFHCRYVPNRYSRVAVKIHHHHYRNDYARKHPRKSFEYRNKGVENRQQLVERRSARPAIENNRRSSEMNAPANVRSSNDRNRPAASPNERSSRRTYNAPVQESSKQTSPEYSRRSSGTQPAVRSESPSKSTTVNTGRAAESNRRVYTRSESSRSNATSRPAREQVKRESHSTSRTYQKPADSPARSKRSSTVAPPARKSNDARPASRSVNRSSNTKSQKVAAPARSAAKKDEVKRSAPSRRSSSDDKSSGRR